jgi:hypothetical protein
MFKYILIGVVCIGIVFSCKKKQPEMSVLNAGCDCAKEVSADFLMEEMSTGNTNFARYTNTDTICNYKNVRFTALEENAEYTWYIGAEVIHEKTFTRYFPNLGGQNVQIKLVVKKKPNTICLSNDDGIDSIKKYLIVSTNTSYSDTSYLLEGVFRLKNPNQNDSVDIKVDFRHSSNYSFLLDLFNYDGQGTNSLDFNPSDPDAGGNSNSLDAFNYRQIWFNMNAHKAMFHHDLNGEITLNIIGNSSSFPSFYYKGRKL